MSAQPPRPDDPLAALAKAASKAVREDDASRTERMADHEAGTARRRRITRTVSIVAVVAISVGVLVYQGPRILNPYHGDDPLEDPQRAKAYVAGVLDDLSAYRARHGGNLPQSLQVAVPESRLPPPGSPYRLEYRIESGAPVVTLQGGREPVTLRGASK
jgi:hypothetical protein